MDTHLFPAQDLSAIPPIVQAPEPPRLRKAERRQVALIPLCVDELLPPQHQARTLWALVEGLDLSGFQEDLKARGSEPGRAATDPKILVALWLWAATQGVGSARELDRLCQEQGAYRWLCGGVSLNYHTLSDFRVGHQAALDQLLTQVLALLLHAGVVRVRRISQDGTRIRASAGASSYRRKATLEEQLVAARQQVEALKNQAQAPVAQESTARQKAAQARAVRERAARVEQALNLIPELEAIKARQGQKKGPVQPARVSTTDPEARVMKMPDGGFRPAFNVQLAQDTESRAIVGVAVNNSGSDQGADQPMRQQIAARQQIAQPMGTAQQTVAPVQEHLVDGGYAQHRAVENAATEGVTLYAPVMQKKRKNGQNTDPYAPRPGDSPEVVAWRHRMASAAGQEIYKLRAATSETCNADLKCHRGLLPFRVRGLHKVLAVTLWSALAYNLLHFGPAVLAALQKG
jgi:transposase